MVKKLESEQAPLETRFVMLGRVDGFDSEEKKDTVLGISSVVLLMSAFIGGLISFVQTNGLGIIVAFMWGALGIFCLHYVESGIRYSFTETHSYQSDEEEQVKAAITKALEELKK